MDKDQNTPSTESFPILPVPDTNKTDDQLALAEIKSSHDDVKKDLKSKKGSIHEETEVPDESLTVPNFAPADRANHNAELKRVLGLDYSRMSTSQREKLGTYLNDFQLHYKVLQNFKENTTLRYDGDLISTIFDKLSDDNFPCLERLLLVLVILSRNGKT